MSALGTAVDTSEEGDATAAAATGVWPKGSTTDEVGTVETWVQVGRLKELMSLVMLGMAVPTSLFLDVGKFNMNLSVSSLVHCRRARLRMNSPDRCDDVACFRHNRCQSVARNGRTARGMARCLIR